MGCRPVLEDVVVGKGSFLRASNILSDSVTLVLIMSAMEKLWILIASGWLPYPRSPSSDFVLAPVPPEAHCPKSEKVRTHSAG